METSIRTPERTTMFVALRDLRHARGRFVLMTSVIALITLLVGFLAALTSGLGRASTSAVVDLPVDRIAFAEPAGSDLSFTESQVDETQWVGWDSVPGVEDAEPLGIAQARASQGETTASVTAFGVEPGSRLTSATVADGQVALSAGAAEDLGAGPGSVVSIGALHLTVSAVSETEADYAHTPVLWVSLDDWQSLGARAGGTDGGQVATVVALTTAGGTSVSPDGLSVADSSLGTRTVDLPEARSAISSYAAENLSLTMMQAFLVAISALVVGAFFTVWTINRSRDIAVLKALGASDGYLLRDAVGQAVVVLALGTGTGALAAAGLGTLAGSLMPVVVGVSTIALPAVALAGLGLVGALLAVVRVTRVDPHAALAAR